MSNGTVFSIKKRYDLIKKILDEKSRRLWAASEAMVIGHGGVIAVAEATGFAESTIRIGKRELKEKEPREKAGKRVRRTGGGRKSLTAIETSLLKRLDELVEPTARGDPMSPLRWTCKSTRKLAGELEQQGYKISHTKVSQLLEELDFSLQSTRKTIEGGTHPDRNAQFEYINNQVKIFQKKCLPVISVDAKKKEAVGNYTNKGKEYQPKGQPEKVQVYDFVDKELGKAIPYGVYDMTRNNGWVNVGTDHDTAEFAVESIRRWWTKMGQRAYPNADRLLITADGGGSNGSRCRLWKIQLQKLSNEINMAISICHFPPGTSKWNKIEHRMFCHISQNWRGRPLISHEIIVSLIANTTTKRGLCIEAELDNNKYQTGIKISDKELKRLNICPADFHGEDWNYTIYPSVN
ncbi:MAG TPA: ISAzo13 family transposase [Candidatus Brocadiaceae bacterium]